MIVTKLLACIRIFLQRKYMQLEISLPYFDIFSAIFHRLFCLLRYIWKILHTCNTFSKMFQTGLHFFNIFSRPGEQVLKPFYLLSSTILKPSPLLPSFKNLSDSLLPQKCEFLMSKHWLHLFSHFLNLTRWWSITVFHQE